MPDRRRHLRTELEIPSDHGVRIQRSSPTLRGYASMVQAPPQIAPVPEPRTPAVAARPAPWTEEIYVSPSGRIFLPPGFDVSKGVPRTMTRRSVRRQPPVQRPAPRRAQVVIGQVVSRPRSRTRESWVVPPHLSPS